VIGRGQRPLHATRISKIDTMREFIDWFDPG
jgi:hypothetical protein